MMMMIMMKMVRRNSMLMPILGGMKMNFRANIQNRSIGTKIEDEQQILCFSVLAGDRYADTNYKVRWYGITPPVSARQKKSCGGGGIALIRFMSTKVKVGPSLLCETFLNNLPSSICVGLNSKIHIIGGKERCEDGGYSSGGVVLDIDTSCRQITVGHGKPMICSKELPAAVVLDGKMYVFAKHSDVGQPPSCEVFDPNTNQWDALPAPSVECLQGGKVFYPLVYQKKKKIFLFCASLATCACAFDVTTKSWEYGVELPSQVINFMLGPMYMGEKHVILGDLLYMFSPDEFYAYDLQKKELLQVHGLEGETRFMICETEEDFSTFLIRLGKKNLCLVIARGPAAGGLHVVCLKFHILKRDGGLHAVILGRDSYYIQQAFLLTACVAIKRPGLGTSAISCFFDPDGAKQEA